jgi:2-aminoadipate transaminase
MLQVLRAGRFEAHVAALRRRYARKAEVMVGAIQERFPAAVRWHEPHGGLYVWARLPASLSAGVKSAVFRSALAQKVSYVPGEVCYAADPTRQRPQNEMRLSFGSASEAEIREGIARLGKVLQRFLAE